MNQDELNQALEQFPMTAALATSLLVTTCHGAAMKAGWWMDPVTGRDIRLSPKEMQAQVGWKLTLIHSEISEAAEGIRTDKMDNHLPQFKSGEVEFADAIIRICDTAGALGYNLGEALAAKLEYNAHRPDHKPEARAAEGGKKY